MNVCVREGGRERERHLASHQISTPRAGCMEELDSLVSDLIPTRAGCGSQNKSFPC